jgi:hypothetical protein
VADAGSDAFGVAAVDGQMLRRIVVDERDRGGEVRRERDPAVDRQRTGEDLAALEAREEVRDLVLHGVRDRGARRHEDRRRVGAMLRLSDEIRGDRHRVGLFVG